MRGMVASWLVHYILERRSRFEPLLGTLRCNLGQDTSLSQCLSPPRCLKMGTSKFNARG